MKYDYSTELNLLSRYAVGFLNVQGGFPVPAGSGTFASFGSIDGVVTCAHVVDALLTMPQVGLVYFPIDPTKFQSLTFVLNSTDYISFGAISSAEAGPDLAFFRLPVDVIDALKPIVSFANMELSRTNALAGEPSPKSVDAVVGVVEEWTKQAINETSHLKVPIEGLINVGKVIGKSTSAGFDLFRFQSTPESGFQLPSSYKGTCGGGLWRLFVSEDENDSAAVLERRLVGVAFYQTEVENGTRDLICHGQSSIYNNLLGAVRSRWPNG
jgi:hypothetical protein